MNRRPLIKAEVGIAATTAAALLMAAALLGLGGCGNARTSQSAPVTWGLVTEASLRAARERWAVARIEVYDYVPYCGSRGQLPGQPQLQPRVSVRDGRATRSSLSAQPGFLDHTEPLTIEGIFDVLEHTAADRSLMALFDGDTGVPLVVCEANTPTQGSWQYCAVGSFHVPQRHGGNPERLRWPAQPMFVGGSCSHSGPRSAP